MKCGYSGCKGEAKYITTQTLGKKSTLPMCDKCAPKWVKEGKDNIYYTVTVRGGKQNDNRDYSRKRR